ncbi:MAG: 2-amino-4-hydroxy-6-hydroxymethyldihydropteridine diphosphokinase [Desulfomonilaceae bacterium]
MISIAYVGFGANLGDPEDTFYRAIEKIDALDNVSVTKTSSIYETDPVGLRDDGPEFLNAVLEVQTSLSPFELIHHLRKIERSLGKNRCHKSDRSRKIDLDLLLFGDKSFWSKTLEVPHPRMNDRGFVLVPLVELAPEFIHPVLGISLNKMLDALVPEEKNGVRLLKSVELREVI